jgi:predicted RNase H-like HicB family nuclease
MHYAVVIENAGGNVCAYAPDLPGCSATDPTVKAVKAAIRFRTEGLRPDRLPVPAPSPVAEHIDA